MNETTEWRASPFFPERYWVSNEGKIYSVASNKILKPGRDKNGYHTYILCANGIRKTVKAHRVVALAFIPNPDHKPAIDHIDGNKDNNNATNLRWVTNKENSNNPLTLAKLQTNAQANLRIMYQKSLKRNFGRKGVVLAWANGCSEQTPSLKIAAERVGINVSTLSEILNGKKPQRTAFTARWA